MTKSKLLVLSSRWKRFQELKKLNAKNINKRRQQNEN